MYSANLRDPSMTMRPILYLIFFWASFLMRSFMYSGMSRATNSNSRPKPRSVSSGTTALSSSATVPAMALLPAAPSLEQTRRSDVNMPTPQSSESAAKHGRSSTGAWSTSATIKNSLLLWPSPKLWSSALLCKPPSGDRNSRTTSPCLMTFTAGARRTKKRPPSQLTWGMGRHTQVSHDASKSVYKAGQPSRISPPGGRM
mmetsp:Transcript_11098/g.31412  ORF Transcript_11098/g.31412 Transcript_11098/m.31412 type:complete len:200 (+) Transcript_11098:1238-1837(+)